MKIILFGATGRVGKAVAEKCLAAGHQVTALVRDKTRMSLDHEHLTLVEGDVCNPESLQQLRTRDCEVVINVIGADPLKPSTLFTDTTRAIIALLSERKSKRYLAITGTAQMEKTRWGKFTIAILKKSPVGHGVRDHQNAFNVLTHSHLDWTLVGCPYIKDGTEKGHYRTSTVFPGGFKTIHPPDVANEIFLQLNQARTQEIMGVWY